jgi:dTDP-glucose pyrophosphorylase
VPNKLFCSSKLFNIPQLFSVEKVIEKPEKPPSNLAVVALYVFKPIIYEAIEAVKPDKRGEIQLTDVLQLLLSGTATFLLLS